jgi:hypothetical protein
MAKSELDAKLERDPFTFMKSYTVQPQDYKGPVGALYDKNPSTSNPTAPNRASADTVLTLTGADSRVAYTKLSKADGSNAANHFNLFFYSKAAVIGSLDDYVACYFLPWTSNHLTKLQIPPKRPARAGVSDAEARRRDPDLFFTAAVNGCSVFVEGDPSHPVVYHAGTMDDRSKLGSANAFVGGSAMLHWTQLFEGNRSEQGAYGSIHKGDYITRAGYESTPEALQYKKFLENDTIPELRIDLVSPEGSVFGVRDGTGKWAFYLQKNIRFVVTKLKKVKSTLGKTSFVPKTEVKNKGFANERIVEITQTIWVPAQVMQFYPGRNDSPQSARLEPRMIKYILEAYK